MNFWQFSLDDEENYYLFDLNCNKINWNIESLTINDTPN